MSKFDYDLFVIGGGSGGVRAARVAAGQAVATAGVLRESGLPGLHFEVRRGSDVLDAVDWLGGEDAVGSLLRP